CRLARPGQLLEIVYSPPAAIAGRRPEDHGQIPAIAALHRIVVQRFARRFVLPLLVVDLFEVPLLSAKRAYHPEQREFFPVEPAVLAKLPPAHRLLASMFFHQFSRSTQTSNWRVASAMSARFRVSAAIRIISAARSHTGRA